MGKRPKLVEPEVAELDADVAAYEAEAAPLNREDSEAEPQAEVELEAEPEPGPGPEAAEAAAESELEREPEPDPEAASAAAEAEPEPEPEAEPDDLPVPINEPARLAGVIESLLFAAEGPLNVKQLRELSGELDADKVRAALETLEDHYRHRGLQLHSVAGGYQFRTHPDNAEWVQKLVAGKPVRLSRAQLETLAIVAYRQPITRPEIDEIRGVDSASTVRVLLERELIRVLGKKEEPGRPLLYGTTREFLEFFNLNDLRDLPTLREYHELTDDSLREVEERLGGEAPERESEEGKASDHAPLHAEHVPPEAVGGMELTDELDVELDDEVDVESSDASGEARGGYAGGAEDDLDEEILEDDAGEQSDDADPEEDVA